MLDYTIRSTDTNEYAGSDRDENLWEEELFDREYPEDDIYSLQNDRKQLEYAEEGYRRGIGE